MAVSNNGLMRSTHKHDKSVENNSMPLLRQLHWLTYQSGSSSSWLSWCTDVYNGDSAVHRCNEFHQSSDDESRQRLGYASSSSLVVRRTRLLTISNRAFPAAASRLWNIATERLFGACHTERLFGACHWLLKEMPEDPISSFTPSASKLLQCLHFVILDIIIVLITYTVLYRITSNTYHQSTADSAVQA